MVNIVDVENKIISNSLEFLRKYVLQFKPISITIAEIPYVAESKIHGGKGILHIQFENGSKCFAEFSRFSKLLWWEHAYLNDYHDKMDSEW